MKPFFIFWLLCCVACTPSPVSHDSSTLRISFATFPPTCDPLQSSDFASAQLLCMLYEGLTRGRPDGSSELAVAESVELSSDRCTYVFHLRETQWEDGSPLTAYDFETSWKRALNPATPSPCSYLLYPIQNGEAAVRGLVPLEAVGIHSLDARTLKVQLHHPTPQFLEMLSLTTFFPTKEALHNGPFSIEKMEKNHEILLTKNPRFWNAQEVYFDHIHIAMIADGMTALHLFEQGELDWIGGSLSPLPLDALHTLSLSKKESIRFLPASATTFCTFNTELFPFTNKHLRKALAYALDLPQIVNHIGQGFIPDRYVPPILCKNGALSLFQPCQLDLARDHFQAALKELGIGVDSFPSLTLLHRSGPLEKQIASTMVYQWKELFGIDIALEQLDAQTQRDRLRRRDYQLSLANWIAEYHDPMNILERFKERTNNKNYPDWEHPEFIHLLNTAVQAAAEDSVRLTILEEAERLLIQEMPFVPIYHWNFPCLCSPHVENLTASPCGAVQFERAKPKVS